MRLSGNHLANALRNAREAHQLSVRDLARRANLSHTQVGRLERGDIAEPSRGVLVNLAHALDRNPAPLLVLAGHLRDQDARLALAPMFRIGAEMPEAWPGDSTLALEEAARIVVDPTSDQESLMQVAASVFDIPETDETLWDDVHILYRSASDDASDIFELIGRWRYVRGARRQEWLRYGRALCELEDLDYLVDSEQVRFEAMLEMPDLTKPDPPASGAFTREDLERAGFEGFAPLMSLVDGYDQPPAVPGVYVVLRPGDQPVVFTDNSVGGWFKRADPSLPLSRLRQEWVDGVSVVYIGRGGNLRRRIDQLGRFGRGEAVGHWGGRALWQLGDHKELLVAWQPVDDPRGREAALLGEFRQIHGRLPFANLRAVNL